MGLSMREGVLSAVTYRVVHLPWKDLIISANPCAETKAQRIGRTG